MYDFSEKDTDFFLGAVGFDLEFRKELASKHFNNHAYSQLIDVICNLISIANKTIENNREMIEMQYIEHGILHPDQTSKLNLPTLFGALEGLKMAKSTKQENLCGGCAYRLGTPANTCASTVCDAQWQLANGDMFWCHENLDEKENPTQKCRGHLLKTKEAA